MSSDPLLDFRGLTAGRQDVAGEPRTRAARTLAEYARHARTLFRQAGVEDIADPTIRTLHVIEWFVGAHEQWSTATIRAYRSALFCLVERVVAWSVVTPDDAKRLFSILEEGDRASKPRPRPSDKPKQTSARKRKSVTVRETHALTKYLGARPNPTNYLLCGLLIFGPTLGLRPSEYLKAEVCEVLLLIKSAKHTNGRGIAPYRDIDITAFTALERAALKRFLMLFRAQYLKAQSWKLMLDRLATALTRACIALKIKPVALYTLRHQALSNAKQFMTPEAVAALAGHKSTRTATRSYAKKRSGWKIPPKAIPTNRMVALVSVTPLHTRKQRTGPSGP